MESKGHVQLSIRIAAEQAEEIRRRGSEAGMTVSEYVRALIAINLGRFSPRAPDVPGPGCPTPSALAPHGGV